MEVNFAAELSAAKSEAIYHFAYGLSHELNNPLANIATRAGVLAKDEDRPDQRSLLVTIVDNAMRGCEMLGDLMIVARPPRLNLEMTPLDAFTRQLAADAQPWLESRGVRLEVDISCQRIALLDKAAFREVLWALLRNASEAMADGGCVSLAARDLAESLVQWEILDQGAGLSAQALEHCFDPYYSGREAGRGLGFGLTKAKRVVELHSGQVKLYNRPCGGCAAVVELPCALPDQRS
jgi:signal transduction histidine kinase